MRLVIELRKDYKDASRRHLCIVKGNYVRDKDKGESYVLAFDEKMRYSRLNERVAFHLLVKPDSRKGENSGLKAKAVQMKQEGMSITEITERLSSDGHTVGRSTVGEWVKDCPAS